MNMRLIGTDFGYNYWKGEDGGKIVYNVVPQNQPAPSGGYLNADYICKVKGVPNMFNQVLDTQPRPEVLGDCQCGQGGCYYFADNTTGCGM